MANGALRTIFFDLLAKGYERERAYALGNNRPRMAPKTPSEVPRLKHHSQDYTTSFLDVTEVLKPFRFAVCFENSAVEGYVTEFT